MYKSIEEGCNQISRVMGHPLLATKIADIYGKKLGRKINAMTEVIVTSGANHALNSVILAAIKPDECEEIIVFEPCFPQY